VTADLHLAVEDQFRKRLAIAGTGFLLVCVAWTWGRWSMMAGVIAIEAVRAVGNPLGFFLLRRPAVRLAILYTLNVGASLAGAHVGQWELPFLFMQCYQLTVIDLFMRPDQRWMVWLAYAATAVFGLIDCSSPAVALATVGCAFLLYYVFAARTSSLSVAFEKLAEQHKELSEANEAMRRMHDQAIRQEKMSSLGNLAAGIAHEINNPMAYVTANVRDLLREIDARPDCRAALGEYVDDVLPATLDGIKRVNTIVADLRRFSRADADDAVPASFDLNEQVEAALRILHGKVRDHCRTTLELGAVPPIHGRAGQMVQVVINLVLNSAEAVARGGLVQISTRRDGDQAVLTVRDDGPGMSHELVARMFEPFFTTKPAGQGTGLGLAVVQGIVEAHGGRIEVHSDPGAGTVIDVRLPAAAPSARAVGTVPMALMAS
jgi:two-component system, NtrC family, sensor kinase